MHKNSDIASGLPSQNRYFFYILDFVDFSQLISRSLALYVISVRRTRDLLTASFRFHLTMDTLAVRLYTSHYLGVFGTFTR